LAPLERGRFAREADRLAARGERVLKMEGLPDPSLKRVGSGPRTCRKVSSFSAASASIDSNVPSRMERDSHATKLTPENLVATGSIGDGPKSRLKSSQRLDENAIARQPEQTKNELDLLRSLERRQSRKFLKLLARHGR
jgi:hypothetical protein